MAGRYARRGLSLAKAAPWRRTAVARKKGSRRRSRRVGVFGMRTIRTVIRKVR